MVGHVAASTIFQGADAIKEQLVAEVEAGRSLIVDAITDSDLMEIGEAVATSKLVTGGSSVATVYLTIFAKRG